MRRTMIRPFRVIAAIIALTILSIVIWRLFLDPELPVTRLAKRIDRQIPAGSTKGRVYEFLESEHLGFSGYNVGPDPLDDPMSQSRERKRYVLAWTLVRNELTFSDYTLRIAFYFDDEELLSEYKTQQLYDKP